jgi:hypothetical protein
MKERLLTGWLDPMRIIRLALGLMVLYQSLLMGQWFMALLGLALAGMAALNYGCCGVNGCAAPLKRADDTKKQEIEYEEVVGKQ